MGNATPRARRVDRPRWTLAARPIAAAVAALASIGAMDLSQHRPALPAAQAQGVAPVGGPPTATAVRFRVEIRPTPHGEPFGPALPGPAARTSPAPTPPPATAGLQAARLAVVAVVVLLALRALRLRDADRR